MIGFPLNRQYDRRQNSNSNLRLSLPLLQGLLPFDRVRIGPDIVAGITLAALGIPEVMGYTKIIGTPVILPVLIYALFGSSRHLVVSADSGHCGGGLNFPVIHR